MMELEEEARGLKEKLEASEAHNNSLRVITRSQEKLITVLEASSAGRRGHIAALASLPTSFEFGVHPPKTPEHSTPQLTVDVASLSPRSKLEMASPPPDFEGRPPGEVGDAASVEEAKSSLGGDAARSAFPFLSPSSASPLPPVGRNRARAVTPDNGKRTPPLTTPDNGKGSFPLTSPDGGKRTPHPTTPDNGGGKDSFGTRLISPSPRGLSASPLGVASPGRVAIAGEQWGDCAPSLLQGEGGQEGEA